MELEIVYGEGWDPERRQLVGRLGREAARARDAAGDPYSVLLEASGVPWLYLDVAWRHHYLAAWVLDETSRRSARLEFRRLRDREVFLLQAVRWHFTDAGQVDFDPRVDCTTVTAEVEGLVRTTVRRSGDDGYTQETVRQMPTDDLWSPAPAFGDWSTMAAQILDLDVQPVLVEHRDPVAPDATVPPDRRPWQPPEPLRPVRPELMSQAGTRYMIPDLGAVTIELIEAGPLRLPTGRLVATDPGRQDDRTGPFTVGVAPGEYPLTLSVARFDADPGHARVAAATLSVRPDPVAAWELALRPGQDPRTLLDGHFFGFGADCGMAALLDASALPVISPIDGDAYADAVDRLPGRHVVELADPASGANVIIFSSGFGDGSYPTWIGRSDDGRVACFVADMLILDRASVLT